MRDLPQKKNEADRGEPRIEERPPADVQPMAGGIMPTTAPGTDAKAVTFLRSV